MGLLEFSSTKQPFVSFPAWCTEILRKFQEMLIPMMVPIKFKEAKKGQKLNLFDALLSPHVAQQDKDNICPPLTLSDKELHTHLSILEFIVY